MRFTKMQGIGNDYIYVDTTLEPVKDPAGLANNCRHGHTPEQNYGQQAAQYRLPQRALEGQKNYDYGKNDAEKDNLHFILST